MAEKLQGNLGIGKLAQGLQRAGGFAGSLLEVCVAEVWASNRGAKQLEVAIPSDFKVARGSAHINGGGSSSGKDKLAFVLEVGRPSAELEADLSTLMAKQINSAADGRASPAEQRSTRCE